MIRALHKRMTYEDRFDRKWRCNVYRFLPGMKRYNRRKFRRKMKSEAIA